MMHSSAKLYGIEPASLTAKLAYFSSCYVVAKPSYESRRIRADLARSLTLRLVGIRLVLWFELEAFRCGAKKYLAVHG